jgi:hypothetical protein
MLFDRTNSLQKMLRSNIMPFKVLHDHTLQSITKIRLEISPIFVVIKSPYGANSTCSCRKRSVWRR